MASPTDELQSSRAWQRVSSLFAEALDRDAASRDRFLKEACSGSVTVELEVRRLLGEYERAGEFLEDPVLPEEAESAPPAVRAGDVLTGRFRVVRLLGAGGMGEVYEAYDASLEQRVAVKTLRSPLARDAAMAQRFRTEVLRSRQITHPNVVRVHDLFTYSGPDDSEIPFFTMELIEGETLAERLARGPLTPAEALPLLQQMAAALEAAHAAGIVHRDFKPSNVFLTRAPDGTLGAKATDFGIAAEFGGPPDVADSAGSDAAATFLAGTPAYMAPEQLSEGVSSPQSDVYALALVAYEMLTGDRAYPTSSPVVCVLQKSAQGEPRLCDGRKKVPARWAAAIHRALRRNPRDRFATPSQFAAAIGGAALRRRRWFAAAAVALVAGAGLLASRFAPESQPRAASIAIVPFVSEPGDQAYLGDGVAEGLSRALSAFPTLRIAPLSAAAEYQKRHIPPSRIAQNLNAAVALTGTVRQTAHRLHVTVQLTDAAGKVLWSQPWDVQAEQLLSVQLEIAQKLAARLGAGAPLAARNRAPTANAEAYDLFLRGRYFQNMRSREGLVKALTYFDRALVLDDNFALAYTGVAESNELLFEYGWMPAAETGPQIRAALTRALAIDPDAAETLAFRGLEQAHVEWNQQEAERAFQQALSRDPNQPEAHHWYASVLWREGRFDEALREALEARRLDPVTLPTLLALAWVRYGRREYPETVDVCRQALELNPNYSSAYQLMAQAYAAAGQTAEALAASAQTQRLDTDRGVALRHRALVLSRLTGYERQARATAAELEVASPDRQAGYLARIYGALHDRDKMYRWANRAIELHDIGLLEAKVDPALEIYRNEPAFQEILRKLGFQ